MNTAQLLLNLESEIVLYAPPIDIRQARIALVEHALARLQAIARVAPLVEKMLASEARLKKFDDSRRLGSILRKHATRDIERGADPDDLAAARDIVARVIAKGGGIARADREMFAELERIAADVQARDAAIDRLAFRSDARFALDTPRSLQ